MSENHICLGGAFSEGYGIIPKKLMRAKDVSPYGKLIMAYMLSYSGAGNECFPGIKTICLDLNISNKTVIKAISELQDQKWIVKERMYPNNPLKHNNKYRLIAISAEVNEVHSRGEPDTPSECTPSTPEVYDVHKNNNSINNNSINNKKVASPHTTNFNNKKISDEYIRLFKDNHGGMIPVQYWTGWGRALAPIKDIMTEKEVIDAMAVYFADKWVIEKKAHSPYAFLKSINKYRVMAEGLKNTDRKNENAELERQKAEIRNTKVVPISESKLLKYAINATKSDKGCPDGGETGKMSTEGLKTASGDGVEDIEEGE